MCFLNLNTEDEEEEDEMIKWLLLFAKNLKPCLKITRDIIIKIKLLKLKFKFFLYNRFYY